MSDIPRLRKLRHQLSSLLAAYRTVEEGIDSGQLNENEKVLLATSNKRLEEILSCIQNEISPTPEKIEALV